MNSFIKTENLLNDKRIPVITIIGSNWTCGRHQSFRFGIGYVGDTANALWSALSLQRRMFRARRGDRTGGWSDRTIVIETVRARGAKKKNRPPAPVLDDRRGNFIENRARYNALPRYVCYYSLHCVSRRTRTRNKSVRTTHTHRFSPYTRYVFSTKKSLTSSHGLDWVCGAATARRRRRRGDRLANLTAYVRADRTYTERAECALRNAYTHARARARVPETRTMPKKKEKENPYKNRYGRARRTGHWNRRGGTYVCLLHPTPYTVTTTVTHQLSSLIRSSGFFVLLSALMRNACGYSESTCSNWLEVPSTKNVAVSIWMWRPQCS